MYATVRDSFNAQHITVVNATEEAGIGEDDGAAATTTSGEEDGGDDDAPGRTHNMGNKLVDWAVDRCDSKRTGDHEDV